MGLISSLKFTAPEDPSTSGTSELCGVGVIPACAKSILLCRIARTDWYFLEVGVNVSATRRSFTHWQVVSQTSRREAEITPSGTPGFLGDSYHIIGNDLLEMALEMQMVYPKDHCMAKHPLTVL